jgi:hypothetical protein
MLVSSCADAVLTESLHGSEVFPVLLTDISYLDLNFRPVYYSLNFERTRILINCSTFIVLIILPQRNGPFEGRCRVYSENWRL